MTEDNYREYLATRVLTDNQPITYRLLSRSLQVHVNVAKQMLFDFHQRQNAKKSKSVHATYLLMGKRHTIEPTNGTSKLDGDNSIMHSSPYMSSMPMTEEDEPVNSPVSKTSIVLAREEELEETRSKFETITSIHVYSLEPGPIKDLGLLAVCNQEIATKYDREDPLERWRAYGSVQNPYIKRRTTKYAPAAAKPSGKPLPTPVSKSSTTVNTASEVDHEKEENKATRAHSTSTNDKPRRSMPQADPIVPALRASESKSGLKREMSAGDLFKSFAKSKIKVNAGGLKDSTTAPVDDEQMLGMSEDEAVDDDDGESELLVDQQKAAAARKAREEREEKTRKMMEADVEMPDVPSEPEPEPEPELESEMQDAPLDRTADSQPTENESKIIVQGGRRRGRRRVTKKKQTQDEDGYLVTKEEMVWESFSENEPEPKKVKTTPKGLPLAKGKKVGGKGQGSIASFFKKT